MHPDRSGSEVSGTSDWSVDDLRGGERARFVGVVFSHDYRCWLVPGGAPRTMDSRERGILLRVPGLGAELLNHERPRVTSGAPMVSVDAEVEGTIGPSAVAPFPFEFVETVSVVLRGAGPPLPLDLARLTELSPLDCEGAESYANADDRQKVYAVFTERRRRW